VTDRSPTSDTDRIPVIRLWDHLLVPLQGDVSDPQAELLSDEVLHRVRRGRCVGLVIDVSGLGFIDSHLCMMLRNLATSARLMGTDTVVSGLSPEVAMTLQSMGLTLEGVATALNLDHALELLGTPPPASARSTLDEQRGFADLLLELDGSGGRDDRT
jgi:rsbT antagonist protein RsbS